MGVFKNGVGRPSNETIKKRNVFKGICILLFIVIIGLVVYILNDKEKIDNNALKKIDENKSLVYDASYDYDKTNYNIATHKKINIYENSFNLLGMQETNSTNYYDDLKVPFINIDNDAAKDVNKKIKLLYDNYINQIEKHTIKDINNGIDEVGIPRFYIDYKTYINENVLSVIITHAGIGTTAVSFNYTSYNFSLKDGKLLSLNDIAKELGYNNDDVKEQLINKVENYHKSDVEINHEKSISFINKALDFSQKEGKIISDYEDNSDDSLAFYVDNNNLNLITYIYVEQSELGKSPYIVSINRQ